MHITIFNNYIYIHIFVRIYIYLGIIKLLIQFHLVNYEYLCIFIFFFILVDDQNFLD